MDRRARVLAILDQVATGRVEAAHFTPDARWWSNGGAAFAIPDFNGLLWELHGRTEAGIKVSAEAVFEHPDAVIVQATSLAKLRNGGEYANRYAFITRFDGELVSEMREYSDTAHVASAFDLDLAGES